MNSRGNAISAYSPAFARGALIYGANIQSGVITSAHLTDLGIVAGEIANGAVTSAKLGTGSVVAVKIGAASVTSAKLGVSAISNTNIKANAIRAGAISARSVTSAKLFAAFLSGTVSGLTSGVVAIAHGLGAKPKFAIVGTIAAHADIVAGTANAAFLAAASAATTTNIYIKTTKGGNVKYTAYVMI